MLAQETRNNNGQARSCEAEFRANTANESRSLLGDLRFNGISMKDQQLTRKKKKDAANFRESMAGKIQPQSLNSYEIYIDGLRLPGPVEAFCLPMPLDILLWQHRNFSGSKKSRQWHSRPRGGHFSERLECFSAGDDPV
jgi:hypothetical protein